MITRSRCLGAVASTPLWWGCGTEPEPEYFCTGYNLQFLYVVWYLKERALRR